MTEILSPLLHGLAIALVTGFNLGRVLLWAILVIAAWYEIIESNEEQKSIRKNKRNSKSNPRRARQVAGTHPGPQPYYRLTASTLQAQNAANGVQVLDGARRWPRNIPEDHNISEMGSDESIDDWSIWGGEGRGESEVGPAAVPTPVHPANGQPTTSNMSEAQFVAAAHMDENTAALYEQTKKGSSGGRGKKEKRPFITRKLDKWFVAPYANKYEHLGYMVYRGFNKMGRHVESGMFNVAESMNASIRDAGVEAVDRVEYIMRRYIKFFGAVTILTVVLLPIPAVHLTLGMP